MTQRRRVRRAGGWLRAELRPVVPKSADRREQQPAAPQLNRARAEFETGQAALAEGRLAVAYNRFVVARGFASGDDLLIADIMAAQGRVRLAQENFGAAADAFREALAHNPAHVEARLGLAELALVTYRPAAAIAALYEALSLVSDPARRARLHLALASTHRREGHPLLARLHLKAAGRLGEVNPLVVAWHFLWTLQLWEWALAVGAVLLVGLFLASSGIDPLRSAVVAALMLIVLVALLGLWAWGRTPL